jgi:hypothetical protein
MHSTAAEEALDADDAFAALVAGITRTNAIIAEAQAEQTRYLAEVGQLAERMTVSSPLSARDHDIQLRSFAAEIGALLRVSDRTVQSRIGRARTVVEDYPVAYRAWGEGRIGPGHLHVITDLGAPLPVGTRAEFEAAAVEVCEGMTPGRARQALRVAADTAHPVSMADRHREARKARGVRAVPIGDGMSEVIAVVPSVIADGAVDRLTRMARTLVDHRAAAKAELKELRSRFCDAFGEPIGEIDADTVERIEELAAVVDDDRTLDQMRADVIGTLLLTGVPGYDPTSTDDAPGVLGGIRGKVQVVVAATTLLGLDDHAADLVGHAPVDPATARGLAGQLTCGFERVITHPVTGAVLAVDTYQRNTALDRYLRARDRTCRFFGCTTPALRCDVDHTTAHAHGGHTSHDNCAHLCRRHHTLKHHSEWKVTQLPGGILQWTSPLGHVYTDHPPIPTVKVQFRPSDEPPPF